MAIHVNFTWTIHVKREFHMRHIWLCKRVIHTNAIYIVCPQPGESLFQGSQNVQLRQKATFLFYTTIHFVYLTDVWLHGQKICDNWSFSFLVVSALIRLSAGILKFLSPFFYRCFNPRIEFEKNWNGNYQKEVKNVFKLLMDDRRQRPIPLYHLSDSGDLKIPPAI
jgi:hypothetical protein